MVDTPDTPDTPDVSSAVRVDAIEPNYHLCREDRRLRNAIRPFLSLVLLVSSVGKALSPHETAGVLRSLTDALLPIHDVWLKAVVLAIIAFEASVAWLFWVERLQRAALMATGLFIALASMVLLVLAVVDPTAGCGCGLPRFPGAPESSIWFGLVRNAVLMLLIIMVMPRVRRVFRSSSD